MAKNNWTKTHRMDTVFRNHARFVTKKGGMSAQDPNYFKNRNDSKNTEVPVGFVITVCPAGKKSKNIKEKGWHSK